MKKVLFVPHGDSSAVSWYRIMLPAHNLINNFKDEVEVAVVPHTNLDYNHKDIEDFDIIHIHIHNVISSDFMSRLYELRDKKGIILIVDIDDYWELPEHNPVYSLFNNILKDKIIENIGKFDVITTTTELFAEKLREYNDNVFVLENGIDLSIRDYFYNPVLPNNRLRIGLITGSSHIKDIELLKGINGLLEPHRDHLQWVLGGYSTKSGLLPNNNPYVGYEKILTDNYSIISNKKYVKFLKRYNLKSFDSNNDEEYVRLNALPINQYMQMFNRVDVIITPLVDDKFNTYKSELKMVEAGMFKKVFIASNAGVYKGINIPKFNNIEECAAIIKSLIEVDGQYINYRDNLIELMDKYDLLSINKRRIQLYNLF